MSTIAGDARDGRRASAPAVTPAVPRPTGAHPATGPALVIGLALLAAGVVAIRDAAVTLGWAAGEPWTPAVLDVLSAGVEPSTALIVVGAIVGLLGLWLLLRALGRRPRHELGLGGESHAWIAPSEVSRIVTLVASDVDGVVSARCRARRRSVRVRVVSIPAVASSVRSEVRDRVGHALTGLEPTPRVSVRVSTLGRAS